MEKLNTSLNFYYKYLFPAFFCLLGVIFILICINNEFWFALVIAVMILVTFINVYRNFYFKLKTVYLDQSNRQLIIKKGKNDPLMIKFHEIESIEDIKIIRVIIIVNLKKEKDGIESFTFVPKFNGFFKKSIAEKLNKLIKI